MDNENIDQAPDFQEAENQNIVEKEEQNIVEEAVLDIQEPEKKKGLHFPSWLNLVLLLSILLLYVLFFVHTFNQPKVPSIPNAIMYQKKGGITIAFVNSDSIKTHYQLVSDLQKNLEAKYASLNKDITTRQNALEVKAGELQKKFDAKQISMDEAQKMDEMLKMEGKKLYDLNQKYSDQMAEEEMRLNKVYVDSMNNYVARFNKNFNFDYILGYSKGGGILFAKDTLDITKNVLEGLNTEYFNKYPESKKNTK